MTDNRTTERVDHQPRVREAIDELMREKDAIDNRTTELLPCPFCGAKAEIFCDRVMTWGLVEHREGCLFPTFPNHHIAESDFEAWNHRAVVVDVERFCEVSGL